MIERSVIEKVNEVADITEVIQDFITLKKRGVNYLGLCPFHNEKTPSFTVSPAKGIFKCFGCGKGGNAISFIMEHEHLPYQEAIKYLAQKYNIEIVEKELSSDEIAKQNERESMLVLSDFAQKYFSKTLWETDEGMEIGLSYLKERGYRETTVEKFQLGYSPEERDAFTRFAQKNNFKNSYLLKTGLSIQRNDKVFDRFSGRIIFPIHSLSGKVIGFGGRTLKQDSNTAKYLNSPESEIYHKSKNVYGLFLAKRSITQMNKCYLVEGYTDVISLNQAGIENVVASSGTALTSDQIRLIKRFTQNITILFDGDEAGIKASLRGIDLILEEGMNVKVLLFPDGEDPDSFSRKHNPENLNKYLEENEMDFVLFKTRLLLEESKNDPIKRATLINDIVKSIAVIPNRINRSVYIRECSNIIGIKEEVLYSEINTINRKRNENKQKRLKQKEENVEAFQNRDDLTGHNFDTLLHEHEIVRFLLNYGNHELFSTREDQGAEKVITVASFIISELDKDDLELSDKICNQILNEFRDSLKAGNVPEPKKFSLHHDPSISKMAADLLSRSYDLSKIWKRKETNIETEEDRLKKIIPSIILGYKSIKISNALKETEEEIKNTSDENEMAELLHRYKLLKETNMMLARQLGKRTIII